MDIIYCAGGNKRLAEIAIDSGYMYGARSDDIRDLRCDGLIDINWKSYNWNNHILAIKKHNPKYAVVPDVESNDLIKERVEMGLEIESLGSIPIIVPKIHGIISSIPSNYLIGISVPSSYAGFLPPLWDLHGKNVHLLGGSPKKQRNLWREYSSNNINVVSVDINCHSKASDFGSYWDGNKWNDDERATIGKY